MSKLVYCGEKTCVHNNQGKCRNKRIALNEQSICMNYSPLIMPNMNSIGTVEKMGNAEIKDNPIGFGG